MPCMAVATLLAFTACRDGKERTADSDAPAIWQRYTEARKAKDVSRALAIIDSMETQQVIATPKADCLRAFVYDGAWQMRLAELYYKKSYTAMADHPAQDWSLYSDAGYRYAYLMNQRGDAEGSLAVSSAILAQAEGNADFPNAQKAYLLDLMAGCQLQLNQQDMAKQTYLKVYDIMVKTSGEKGNYPFNMLVACCNTFGFFLHTGDYGEAAAWLTRCEEALRIFEQHGDSTLIEEYRGHIALKKTALLQATGRETEAAATYNAIPDSRIFNPTAFSAAASYLMAAGRYDEAADMYARLDTPFIAADSARKNFDIINDRIAPRYTALRKAGRDGEALEIADRICTAIDSALAWQKKDDAAELAVVYQTHERDLQLTNLRFTIYLHRLLAVALGVILLLVGWLLVRARIYNKMLAEKNRCLFEQIQQREQAEEEEREEMQAQPAEALSQNQQLYNRLCELMKDPDIYTDADTNHDTLARMLASNRAYLYAALHECAGQTPADFINLYRIRHAAMLLTTTDNPIGLIIEQSGITNRSTFNRLFREHYSMSPTEYRNAAKQA